MKISFEVDQSKLFDVVAEHGIQVVMGDIIGHLLTGKSGFGARIRMKTYGIEPFEVEEAEVKGHEI